MIYSSYKYEKDTFFEHAAYGKAVIFDPNKDYKYVKHEHIDALIIKIQRTVLGFFDSFYRIQEAEGSEWHYKRVTDAMQTVFWIWYFDYIMMDIRKKKKISFLKLYDLALKEARVRLKEGIVTTYILPESCAKADELIDEFEYPIKKLIKRVLFMDQISKYEEPIIVVTEEFHEEYFYQLSPYVKGLVIRNVNNPNEVVEFAHAFEIPMVKSQEEIQNGDKIIIDNKRNHLYIKPSKELYDQYIKEVDGATISRFELSKYGMKQLKIFANIVDTRPLESVRNRQFYYSLGLFRTEYFFMTKGMVPFKEELTDVFVKVFNAFMYREVNVRIPDFGEFKHLNYLSYVKTSITENGSRTIIYEVFFEALVDAIIQTKATVNVVAPMIRDERDIPLWKEKLDFIFEKIPNEYKPKFGIMLESENSVDEIEKYVKKMDFNIIGLNDLIEEVSFDFNRYDELEWPDFEHELFTYIQQSHQHMRRTGIRLPHMISGNMIRNERLFQKLINMGFTQFIIPLSQIRLAEKLVANHEATRGRYVGVAQKRREAKKAKEKNKEKKD